MEYRKGPVTIPTQKGTKACPFPPNMPRTQIDTTLFPFKYQPKTRFNLQNLGKWGMILLALSLSAQLFLSSLDITSFFWTLDSWLISFQGTLLRVCLDVHHISCWFIAAGFMLSGFVFLSKWQSTGSRTALMASVFSFISPWWTAIAELLELTGLPVMAIYAYNESEAQFFLQNILVGPLYLPYCLLTLLGFTLMSVTLMLWAIGLIRIPKPPTNRVAMIIASLLCCWAAVYLLRLLPTLILWLNTPAWIRLPIYSNPFIFPEEQFPIPFFSIQMSFSFITIPAIILSAVILNKPSVIDPEVSPAPKTHKPRQTHYWVQTSLLILTTFFLLAILPFTLGFAFNLLSFYVMVPLDPTGAYPIYFVAGYLLILLCILLIIPFIILFVSWYKHTTKPENKFLTRTLLAIGAATAILGGFNLAICVYWDIFCYIFLHSTSLSIDGYLFFLLDLVPLIVGLISLAFTRRATPNLLNSQLPSQLEGGPPPQKGDLDE